MQTLTPNQILMLDIVAKKPDHWHDISNVCMIGQFNGKGRSQVIAGLVKRGLIESRIRDVGVYKSIYRECIMLTKAGREILGMKR